MMPEGYRKYYPVAAAVAVLLLAYLTFFPVRETEFVLVTQFGRPIRTITEAGLAAKWPYQTAIYFDRRLRAYNPRPSEFLTRDKKNIVIESYVVWKIADPARFVETVGDSAAGEMRLHDIVWSGLAAALRTHDLDSIVGPHPAKVQTATMLDSLAALTGHAALEQYGIDVVDVRIKRLNRSEEHTSELQSLR